MDRNIKYIKDTEGNDFFPVAHEKGVVDDNGTTLESKLLSKQDTISDLSTIRNGANLGTSSVQSVTVGTTTTGAAGTNASVTNTGTTTAPVLSFTIPQGAQGVKGDTVIMGSEATYTLYNTTGDAVDGAMTQQAVTRELTELEGEVFPKPSASDFSISDEGGNNIVDFNRGHIKTEKFNSETVLEKLDGIEDGAEINNTETINSVSDFSISDKNGNNVVDFKKGHIKTKNFDSETTIEKLDTIEEGAEVNNTETINSVSDFSVADENGNNVVEINGGHIKTKHFDSENIIPEPSLSDFAVSDKNGNKVLEVDNGDIKTKNFDSTYYGFGKPLHISIVASGGVSSKIHEGEYGFNVTTRNLYTIENGNLKDVTNLLDDKTIYTLPGTNENDLYLWNSYHFVCINDSFRDIIPKIPYMQFEVDTELKNSIHDDYELIDYSSPYTILEQVYALFDDLVSDYGDYITKVDAAEEVGLSYPSYTNLNGQASGDYLATPTYKTYMYKLHDNDVRLGNNGSWNHKRKIFLIGGLHGNERISPFNLYMLAANLCKRFLDDINTFKLRGTYDFYIIPCLNGYGMYHGTRANANNVNINRNFPCPWWEIGGQEHMDDPNLSNYTGPTPASEFETKIVVQQGELIKPDIFIDNHNYGEESHIYYCSLMSYKWAPLASPAEIYAAYAFKKAYPQYFGTIFKGLIYDDNATSPKIYYGPGTSLDCMSYIYFDWKYPKKFSCCIEYPPHIKVRDGVWTGVNEVPMYSEDVLRLDEYLLRMHLQIISNVFLKLNS